jgi:hypothetical protein
MGIKIIKRKNNRGWRECTIKKIILGTLPGSDKKLGVGPRIGIVVSNKD